MTGCGNLLRDQRGVEEQDAKGEREFPFPVIPGNTSLIFPFQSRSRELGREILSLFAVLKILLTI